MANPTLDLLLARLDSVEHQCTDLARQTKAHGQILEKVQARLTELERAPRAAASRAAAFESEYARDLDRHGQVIATLVSRLDRHHDRLDRLEAAAEPDAPAPTGYEGYSDAALLVTIANSSGETLSPDLYREICARRDAR